MLVALEFVDLAVDFGVVVRLAVAAPRVGIRDRSLLVFLACLAVGDVMRRVSPEGAPLRVASGLLVLVAGFVSLVHAVRLVPRPARPRVPQLATAVMVAGVLALVATVLVEDRLPTRGPALRLGMVLIAGWLVVLLAVAFGLISDSRRRGQQLQVWRERVLGASLVVLVASFVLRVLGRVLGSSDSALLGVVLGTVAVLAIGVSFVPPAWLRAAWSRRDAVRLAVANRDLITHAADTSELLERALSAAIVLYDADAAALLGDDGDVLAIFDPEGRLGRLQGAEEPTDPDGVVVTVAIPRRSGAAHLVLAPHRFTPLLGDAWLLLLDSYRTALGVAMDRVDLVSQEMEQGDQSRRLLEGLEDHDVGVVRVEGHRIVDVSGIFGRSTWSVWEPISVGVDVRDLADRSDKIGQLARAFARGRAHGLQRLRWVVDVASALDRAPDAVVYDCSVSLSGLGDGILVVQDVSELHLAESEASHRLARLVNAEAVASIGSWEWDVRGELVTWSEELCRLYGEDPATFRPSLEDYQARVDPRDREAASAAVARALQQGAPWELTYRVHRADGALRWFESRGQVATVSSDGTVLRLHGTCRDVTEQMAALDELVEHRGRLQQLSRRLVDAQEEERRQLALRLHDDLGQVVTGLDLRLAAGLSRGSLDDVAGIRTDLQELHRHIRDLAHELRPPALEDLGLSDAVTWLARRAEERFGIDVVAQVQCTGLDDLPMDLQVAAYRILQEALTNAARHVPDPTVQLVVQQADGELLLEVTDDGPGFDPHRVRSDATGLSGMHERATAVGGELTVASELHAGTAVRARLPLRAALDGSGDDPLAG